ncbi:MAG: hypothetical protein AABX16_02530 [Nanoarchaeota archaeon]
MFFCFDPDETLPGRDLVFGTYLRTTVTSSWGNFTDYCRNGVLIEYNCIKEKTLMKLVYEKEVKCPNGCSDGACNKTLKESIAYPEGKGQLCGDGICQSYSINSKKDIEVIIDEENFNYNVYFTKLGVNYLDLYENVKTSIKINEKQYFIEPLFEDSYDKVKLIINNDKKELIEVGDSLVVDDLLIELNETFLPSDPITIGNRAIARVILGEFPVTCPQDCTEFCEDLDGVNYFKKSTTRKNNQPDRVDRCFGDNILEEFQCEDNNGRSMPFQCPFLCVDGECIPPTKDQIPATIKNDEYCKDNDGINFFVKGNSSDARGAFEDYCLENTSEILIEYFCYNGRINNQLDKLKLYETRYVCSYGCKNGHCNKLWLIILKIIVFLLLFIGVVILIIVLIIKYKNSSYEVKSSSYEVSSSDMKRNF